MRAGAEPVDAWMLPAQLTELAGGRRRGRTARDWAVDLGAFAAAVLWMGTELEPLLNGTWGVPPWLVVVDLVAGSALCLALWWRRRFPTALAVIGVLVAAVSNTGAGAMFVLLFTVALHRGWTRAVPITAAGVVISIPYVVTYLGEMLGGAAVAMAVITLLMLLSTTSGLAVRARRHLVLSMREQSEAQRREHELRLAEAQQAERRRIAREMHDVLAHRISLLSVHAGALEYRLARATGGGPPPSTDELGAAAGVVRATAHQALEELQQVLRLLRRPEDTDDGRAAPQPALDQLPRLLDEARAGGQRVDADLPDTLGELPPAVQRTLFRVVQEALTNARKHAPGARVVLSGQGEPGRDAVVRVRNAMPVGVTAAEIPGAGTGLLGLAERVAVHGGELTTGLAEGEFRLCARVPWPT
jgi:signal transduction histidine kinase